MLALQLWIQEMSAHVKSLAPMQLVTIGSEGFFGPSTPGGGTMRSMGAGDGVQGWVERESHLGSLSEVLGCQVGVNIGLRLHGERGRGGLDGKGGRRLLGGSNWLATVAASDSVAAAADNCRCRPAQAQLSLIPLATPCTSH